MDTESVQLVGTPCGQHGPYTFYRAFKYSKKGVKRIVKLSEFFFVKLWSDSDLVSIGELQLLWLDTNSEQILASLRLYFLPENTPEGRMDHGEDEVLAISEKVVLRLEDLVTWITVDTVWTWGRIAKWKGDVENSEINENGNIFDNTSDISDIEKEKTSCDNTEVDSITSVVILSYPQYCRYRAIMKRLDGVEHIHLSSLQVQVLGGFAASRKNTRVLFCRDTFDYPELEGHEMLCNHLAPKLKGRPRGRRKKRSVSPGSESNESECSVSASVNFGSSASGKKITSEGRINGILSTSVNSLATRRSTRSSGSTESKEFLDKLTAFMRTKRMPMSRIPILGYRELNLFALYTKVVKLGGYEAVTFNRLWKSIFDDLSGSYTSTSAATIIRRHYERLLLPYEKHMKGEVFKPSRATEMRKKSSSASGSDAEGSESTSSSGNSTPIPQPSTSGLSSSSFSEVKETTTSPTDRVKTSSSLRSIRVKAERLREGNKEKPVDTSDSDKSDLLDQKSVTKVEESDASESAEKLDIKVEKGENEVESNKSTSENRLSEEDREQVKTETEDVKEDSDTKLEIELASPKKETEESSPCSKRSIESVEVPQNNKEITDVGSILKKRKLDILKEGGLEVTPVKSSKVPTKETRPSVIQQNHAPPQLNTQISVSLMPESIKVPTYLRRNSTTSKEMFSPIMKDSFLYKNDKSPPTVLQSKSIYSYSEKTVYGNPKDFNVTVAQAPYTPKYYNPTGGDILDLTVKSPNKPVSEIERMSNVVISSQLLSSIKDITCKNPPRSQPSQPSLPLLGAKIGSNLEITLVGSNSKSNQYNNNGMCASYEPYMRVPPTMEPAKTVNKRKNLKEENGRYINSVPNVYNSKTSYVNSKSVKPEVSRNLCGGSGGSASAKQLPSGPSPHLVSGYMNPLSSLTNKMLPPYSPLPIDPVYYNALQNLYPHGAIPAVPPFFPTREQMQIYAEMMSQSAQMRYPYPFTQGNGQSMSDNSKK